MQVMENYVGDAGAGALFDARACHSYSFGMNLHNSTRITAYDLHELISYCEILQLIRKQIIHMSVFSP